jgi:predicted metal-dependent hydrolase
MVLQLGSVSVDVIRKGIKNIHLSVHPPSGRVRIAAPERIPLETIRLFAISKLTWIRTQQKKLTSQPRETPREYLERESHYLWGRRYLLEIRQADGPATIEVTPRRLVLRERSPGAENRRQELMEAWYREQVRTVAGPLIPKWETILGVRVASFQVRKMKTKWGSCTPQRGTIRLNTDLAKKPPECLEYIIVHEMIHLVERTHNKRFQALLNQYMPGWVQQKALLNELPVRHEEWERDR